MTAGVVRAAAFLAVLGGLAAFGALVVGGGCKDGSPSAAGGAAADDGWTPEPEPEAKDFVLTVTAAETTVPVGGDLVFKVKVENRGDVKARVNVPRLGTDSTVFKVRGDALANGVASLDPERVRETAAGVQRSPPEAREIAKGESAEGEIRVAAVLVGKLTFTAVYRCQALPGAYLTASPVTVDVVPAPAGSRVGVRFETSHGTIDERLRPDLAFQTCTSFATLVKAGFFDGLKFHRVIAGFMAQGGDPQGQGWGGPGYWIRRELHGKLPHRRGVLSMARQENPPDSAGSQFFVMFREAPHLDSGGYTTFGEMIAGDDALARIESVAAPPTAPGGSEAPREPITITKATLLILP